MKILKIFGLVVGIHVVAFMFVFAIPGCRSTTRHSPPPPASVQAERTAVPAPGRTPAAEPLSPVSAGAYSPPVDHALNPATTSAAPTVSFPSAGASSGPQRFNPTRPGTSVATALQTAPPPEMTPASTYTVASGDNLWKIAKKNGLTSKELAAANNLRSDASLREGQKLLIPGKATPMSAANAQPTTSTGDTLVYKVKAGDSLALIAKRAGTTPAAIRSLNHLKNDMVRAGQELSLPAGSAAATMATAPATESFPPAPKAPGGAVHHVVKSGENLATIARHYGISRSELAVANNIADPLKVRAGMDLVIPNAKNAGGNRAATTPKAAPPPAVTPETNSNPSPISPIAAPADSSPIAPGGSTPSTPIHAPPPEVPVQDVNPVGSPRS